MDLFLLKKALTVVIMPISLLFILLVLAIFYFRKRPSTSVKCLLSAMLLFIFSSVPAISDQFMLNIENNYRAFTKSSKPIDYIVILGSWHTKNDELPTTSQLNNNALQRVVEALRIYKLHPEAKIITSGYHSNGNTSHAQKLQQTLMLLNVPEHKIITENFPKDTKEEAQLISARVQESNMVLVTNAVHMPRAMRYFETQGVKPIPAPTGFWVKNINSPKSWQYYVPSSAKLQQTTVAWYETLGRLIQWFNSFI